MIFTIVSMPLSKKFDLIIPTASSVCGHKSKSQRNSSAFLIVLYNVAEIDMKKRTCMMDQYFIVFLFK